MKKRDSHFNHLGKKMPYKVDDNFFEDVTSKILEQLKKEEKNKLRYPRIHHVRPRRRYILYWSSSVAALIALAFLWQVIYHADKPNSFVSENRTEKNVSQSLNVLPILTDTQVTAYRPGNTYIEDISVAYNPEPVSEITQAADSLIQNISDEELLLLAEMIGVNTYEYKN